jgi:hypothetical protein
MRAAGAADVLGRSQLGTHRPLSPNPQSHCAVHFKLNKLRGGDDLVVSLHTLLFKRKGGVSAPHQAAGAGSTGRPAARRRCRPAASARSSDGSSDGC